MMTQQLIDYAATSKQEVCGLIVNSSVFIPCANIHEFPATDFRISDEDFIRADNVGEVTAVFHSHPGEKRLVLSPADRVMQISTGLEWWLASGGELRKFRCVEHLIGRHFKHGSVDCYSLFRDAYHLAGVDLPDFERADGWWLRGENLYLNNLQENGFYPIQLNDIQPGDIILRKPFPGADPCHAMVYLDDNKIIHHDCAGHVSRREPYRLAYANQTHSVWRFEGCSRLDLRGIYQDITAKL